MTWIKSGENLYTHDTAPFIIENINSIWGIRDVRDKTSFIPFSDIFNNPVFPIDLSNADVIVKTLNSIGAITGDSLSIINASLSKHFRGESNNTPSTPAFSFQGNINTGLYRIAENKVGFAANGIKQGEFGVGYGGFTGNIVQVVSETQNFTQSFTTTYSDINKASGIVWETVITPKFANSRLLIIYKTSTVFNSVSGGFRILQKIANGSYSVIYRPEEQNATSPFSPVDFGSDNAVLRSQNNIPVINTPTYNLGDSITVKIQGASSSGTFTVNSTRPGNNGHSEIFVFEIAG